MKKENNPKRIKKISLIILLLVLSLITTSVHAGTNDSVLIRNKQYDVYAIAPLSDRTHLYNLEMYTINDTPAYCIELGKSITNTTYNSIDNIEEQKRITNLTNTQLEYIKLVSFFGYLYKNHTSREYYMATQEIIWEYLNNIDITWTSEENFNGPKINIDSYKNEILDLINNYNGSINMPNQMNLTVGDTLTYTDNDFVIYKLNSDIDLGNIASNTLSLKFPDNFIGTTTIRFELDNNLNEPPKIYNNQSNSQILLSRGYIPSKTKEITFNIKGKTLTTNLIDKETRDNIPQGQATLEGAIYEIYDKNNNLITTFTTNNTLINTIENLYNEKYYIKQIEASTGYKINKNIIEVDLTKKNRKTLEEEIIKSNVEITKSYQEKEELKPENDIEFTFYYTGPTNGYFGNIITKNGIGSILLPYGKYIMTQENTTYGYQKIDPINIDILTENSTSLKYNLINKPITIKLNIITKDKDTNNNIKEKNIKYKIKDINNNYLTYNNEDTFSTNESGEVLLPMDIPYGTYIIEQVSNPTNYLENNEEITIKIDENNDNQIINIDYFNTKKEEQIILTPTNTTKISIPNTLSNKKYKISLINILILIGVIIYKKINKHNHNIINNNTSLKTK